MSYSGSSLLGFVLGAPSEMWNLGEVKEFPRVHKLGRICTCKKATLDCPYWGPLYQSNLHVFNKGTFWLRLGIMARIILGKRIDLKKDYGDAHMLSTSLQHSKEFEPKAEWLVDTSKSIWRLIALSGRKEIDLKILYLKRGAKENIASAKKYGHSFFKATLEYAVFHYLSKRWLQLNHSESEYAIIRHEDLCFQEESTIKKIEALTGLDYTGYKELLKSKLFHIRTGNQTTVDQFRSGFKGFYYDSSWKTRLSTIQKRALNLLFRDQ